MVGTVLQFSLTANWEDLIKLYIFNVTNHYGKSYKTSMCAISNELMAIKC